MVELFLSDLCGREEVVKDAMIAIAFLSDLCGREGYFAKMFADTEFLSDLCGREELKRTHSLY